MKKKSKKKTSKQRIWILGIIAVIIIAVLVNLGIKVNFLAKDELHIGIDPLQTNLKVVNNKPFELNFTVTNNNFWFCNTECELKLYDPYKEEYVETKTVELKSNSEFEKNYLLNLKESDEGQRVFYFEVVCNNVKTQVCQTSEKEIHRSAYTRVNYALDEEIAQLRDDLRPKLKSYAKQVDYAQNLANEIEELTGKSNNLNKFVIRLNYIHDLWTQSQYGKIVLDGEINDTIKDLENQKSVGTRNIESFNLIVNIIDGFEDNWDYLNKAYKLSNREVRDVADTVKARIFVFNESDFEDSYNLSESFVNLNQTFFNVLEKFDYDQKEQDIISKHSRIQSRVNNELSTDYSLKGDGCEKTKNLIENYEQINTNANLSLVNYSEYFNSTQFTTNKDAFLKAVVFNLTVEPGFIINNTFYNNSLNLTAKNYYSILEFDYSNVEDFESAACSNTTLDIDFGSFEYINVSEYETKSFTEVEFNISEPECCIFGNCSKCKLNPELYPVIFVHGHSSFEKTPVENSYISLSKMQIRMGHEGFVNMGDIDIDTLKVDWYGMNYPVAVKGSYYYTIYYDAGFSAIVKKSLSIENYAIRLKEIVDTVKENTGAEKIVIVAHSMGGLVAREYMLLFGEDDVDKLIVIGTPNQGISGRAKQFCAALGNDKECEDMYKDSVFMKRLNHYIPKTDVYTIYGSGCDTDGKDGDGVIPADDVKLDYAKNFEVDGVCEDVLGVDLHRDMVDPEKYSEVYEIVSEIINP